MASASDPALRSQIGLALGNSYRGKKDLKNAIAAYQQALLDSPANAAARKNIELTRAMKRIQDLQPKQENPDGEPSEGDGSKDENKDQNQADGGVSDGGPPSAGADGGVPPDDPSDADGGPSEGGSGSSPEAPDATVGAEDGGSSGAAPEPSEPEEQQELEKQDVEQLLDALGEREQALKRKRLIERYGTERVEKDW